MHIAHVNVDRCLILDNTTWRYGGGVAVFGVSGSIRNSVIARNRNVPTGGTGGGLSVEAFQFEIESCTIVENTNSTGGGVAFFNVCPTATMTNTIVWNNQDFSGLQQVYHMSYFGQSVATIRHCDIEGGTNGILNAFGPPANVSEIFDLDPLFVDQAAGDYRLSGASPLVDMGDPALFPRVNEADFQGEPRRNGTLDLGADERHPDPSLSLPSPGRAAESNVWTARGTAPGSLVLFLEGSIAGAGPPPEECPSALPAIADSALLGRRFADASGTAVLRLTVPAFLGGQERLFQALVLDPGTTTCHLTNLVRFVFP